MPVLTLPAQSASSLPTLRAKALVFEDPKSRALLQRLEQLAPSEASILLTGETGTGKEIVARQIHQLSRRSGGPFAAVNCGALSENLVESELFGHEKGAFTGALQSRAGWFETAHGGTLFLDEVGDLPLSVQVKLLRVLQESEVVRVGSRRAIPINVRLIAATNVNLVEAMVAGHFREDLFYRLNVAALTLPALRDRPGDIAPLADYFVRQYTERLGLREVRVTDAAQEALLKYPWPGNIRELENAIHHALLVCRNGLIRPEDLRLTGPAPSSRRPSTLPPPPEAASVPPVSADPFAALERAFGGLFELGVDNLYSRVEETLMRTAYLHCERNQLQTARLLGISRNVVRARLIQFGDLAGTLRGSLNRNTPVPKLEDSPTSEIPVSGALYSRVPSRPPSYHGLLDGDAAPLPSYPVRLHGATQRLRIGFQRFGQLLLVKALGELDRALAAIGIGVEWIEYPAGLQLVDALEANELDMGVVGECPPVFAQAADAPIVYLGVEAIDPRNEAILVSDRSPVFHVSQLAGKTVALNRGANVHYLLIRALQEVGLNYEDLEVRFMTPPEAHAAFMAGSIDAWAIWEPWLSSVRKATGARVLRDGTGLTENNAYYVARRDVAEHMAEALDIVLYKVAEASTHARRYPAEVARLLATVSNLEQDVLERWIGGLAPVVRMTPAQVTAQQAIADQLFQLNLLPQPIRVAEAQLAAAPRYFEVTTRGSLRQALPEPLLSEWT